MECLRCPKKGAKSDSAVKMAFDDCVECECNKHSNLPCDPIDGTCQCEHNTAGPHCELCAEGFFGNALNGKANDCQACPCPKGTSCAQPDIFGADVKSLGSK